MQRGRALPLCSRDDSIHTVSGLLVSSMRHSLICVHPDGTIEGVVSLTDIFSFLLNTNAPAAESRIAALMKDYAQFESQEAARISAEAAEAADGGLEAGGMSSAQTPTASGGVTPIMVTEDMMRRATFLADHGQTGEDAHMIAAEEQHGHGTLPVSAATLQSALAAGAPPIHNNNSNGVAAAAASAEAGGGGVGQGHMVLSPSLIRPSPPNDHVPKDMDFLE